MMRTRKTSEKRALWCPFLHGDMKLKILIVTAFFIAVSLVLLIYFCPYLIMYKKGRGLTGVVDKVYGVPGKYVYAVKYMIDGKEYSANLAYPTELEKETGDEIDIKCALNNNYRIIADCHNDFVKNTALYVIIEYVAVISGVIICTK